jgi:hypothetical protein
VSSGCYIFLTRRVIIAARQITIYGAPESVRTLSSTLRIVVTTDARTCRVVTSQMNERQRFAVLAVTDRSNAPRLRWAQEKRTGVLAAGRARGRVGGSPFGRLSYTRHEFLKRTCLSRLRCLQGNSAARPQNTLPGPASKGDGCGARPYFFGPAPRRPPQTLR